MSGNSPAQPSPAAALLRMLTLYARPLHCVLLILNGNICGNFGRLKGLSMPQRYDMQANAAVQAQFWAPAAAAAGVSLVMAYLNGVAIPDLLSLRTLIAKCVQLHCGCSLQRSQPCPVLGTESLDGSM